MSIFARKKNKKKKKAAAEKAAAAVDLTLFTESGQVVHVSPPAVNESLRYMVGRSRLTDGVVLPDRVGLTSSVSGEGVTTISRSLALVLSNDAARRVCLVDLDWWSPSWWPGDDELVARGGAAAVIRGSLDLDEALIPTGNIDLDYLPAGATTPGERPALSNSSEVCKLLVELSERYDNVIIDLPAVHATSESLALAEAARTIVLVVAQGVTPEADVKSAMQELSGTHLFGAILNRAASKVPNMLLRRVPGL